MRMALAIAVIAVAWAAAIYVHQRHFVTDNCGYLPDSNCGSVTHHPSWEDPAAVLLALGGVAVAVGIVATGRERKTS